MGMFDDLIPAKAGAATEAAVPAADLRPSGWDMLRMIWGQGGAAGFGDEIEAGVRSALPGRTYDEELSKVRADIDSFVTNHPALAAGSELYGAIVSPINKLVPGARGGSIGQQAKRGAMSGALYGSAYGAGTGDDAEERLTKAGAGGFAGGFVGGIAPPIIAGAAKVAEPLVNAVAGPFRGLINPAEEAARRVGRAIGIDNQSAGSRAGLNPGEFARAKSEGQPVVNMDRGGESVRALARSASNTSTEARNILEDTLEPRAEAQVGRVKQFVDGLVYGKSNASAERARIKTLADRENDINYRRAMRDGEGGLWDEELERLSLSPAVQWAIRSATKTGRDRAVAERFTPARNPFVTDNGKVKLRVGQDGQREIPTLRFWDQVKKDLGDLESRLVGSEKMKGQAGVVTQLRQQLSDHLDQLVPSYKQARGVAANFFNARDALEAGEMFAMSKMQNRELAPIIGKMKPAERQLFAQGFVSKLIAKLDEAGQNRNLMINEAFNSPAAKQRIQMALGTAKARELEAFLRVETVMQRALKAMGNSTTVRQLSEMGLAGGAGYTVGTGGDVLNPNSQAIMAAALAAGAIRGGRAIDQGVVKRVAEMLVSDDPAIYQKAVRMISKSEGLMRMITAAGEGLGRAAGQQGAAAAASQ